MSLYIYTYKYIHTYIYTHIYVCQSSCRRRRAYHALIRDIIDFFVIYGVVYVYIYIYIHTYIYTYIYVYQSSCRRKRASHAPTWTQTSRSRQNFSKVSSLIILLCKTPIQLNFEKFIQAHPCECRVQSLKFLKIQLCGHFTWSI